MLENILLGYGFVVGALLALMTAAFVFLLLGFIFQLKDSKKFKPPED